MKENSSKSAASGLGFPGLLTIAFIVLKLCGVIQWSWWWVVSPILFEMASVLLGLFFYFALSFVSVKARNAKKKRLQERKQRRE